MSMVDQTPTALQPLVTFIVARLHDREKGDDALGTLLTNVLGLAICDASDEHYEVRQGWAREILSDLAYLWCDHADYRPQWLPMPMEHRT